MNKSRVTIYVGGGQIQSVCSDSDVEVYVLDDMNTSDKNAQDSEHMYTTFFVEKMTQTELTNLITTYKI